MSRATRIGWTAFRVQLVTVACAVSLAISAGAAPGTPPLNPTLAGTRLYDNTGNPLNTYYTGQGGAEAIDDLHLLSGGSLDTLTFEYFQPAAGDSFSATVRIYDNPNGSDASIAPLAGPYVVTGLPSGRRMVSVPLTNHPVVGAHIWVGVRFSSATVGLILNSVPSSGGSHDHYVENGDFFWFGGDPRANFALRLVGAPSSVGVGDEHDVAGVALAPARPNPFRVGSTLSYSIARSGRVRLDVLDLSGRRVRSLLNGVLEAGDHTARWSGRDDSGRLVAAGVYFVRLESAATVATTRLVFAP